MHLSTGSKIHTDFLDFLVAENEMSAGGLLVGSWTHRSMVCSDDGAGDKEVNECDEEIRGGGLTQAMDGIYGRRGSRNNRW
jgi:hypothetical protein